MKGRATIIHRQGSVDVAVCSVPMDAAPRTFSNFVKAMKHRAESVWGVRFVETPACELRIKKADAGEIGIEIETGEADAGYFRTALEGRYLWTN